MEITPTPDKRPIAPEFGLLNSILGRLIERVARRALIAEKDREAAFVAGWIRSITGT